MDNSPRFSEVSVVSSFAYSDELNFAPSTKLKNSQPSLPNQEVPTRPATKRAQPSLTRSTTLQPSDTRAGAGGTWQRSLRSSKSINDASTRRLDGTLSRQLSTRGTDLSARGTDLSSSMASSLSIPDSSVSKSTRASTIISSRVAQDRASTSKTSRLAELAHLQEQLEIKSRLLSAMEQQVLNAVQQIEDLQKEQELTKCEKQLLQDECAQLRTENAGLNGQMKHLKESRLKLHRRCQEAEEGMSQLKKQLDDMKANSDVACVSADICKAALAQSLSEALAIHFRMLEAQSLLQNCQSELEMHRRHVRQLSDMLEQMHCQLSGALDQLEQATNSERQLKQQLATLQQEVNQALDRLAESQQHHAALQTREVELLEQLEQVVQERLLSVSSQPEEQPSQLLPAPLADKACSTEDYSTSCTAQGCKTEEDDTHVSLTIPSALDPVVQSRLQDWLKAAVQQGEVAAQLLESAESSPLAGMDSETQLSSAPPPMLLHWAEPKRSQGEAAESPRGIYRRRPPLASIKGLALDKLLQDPSPRPHHHALLSSSTGQGASTPDARIIDLSTRSSCSLIDVNGEKVTQHHQTGGMNEAGGQLGTTPGTIIEWSGPDGVMYRMKLEQLLLGLLDLQQRCRLAMSAPPLHHLSESNSEHAASSALSQEHDIMHEGTPAQQTCMPSSASESHLLVLDPASCSEAVLYSDPLMQEGDGSLPAAAIAAFIDAQFSSDLDHRSWSDSVSSLEGAAVDPHGQHLLESQVEPDPFTAPWTHQPTLDEPTLTMSASASEAAADLTLAPREPTVASAAPGEASSAQDIATESVSLPNLSTALNSSSHVSNPPCSAPDPAAASPSADVSAVSTPTLNLSTPSATSSAGNDSLLQAQRQLQSVAGQLRSRIAAAAERLVVAEREADLQLKLREAGTLMSRAAHQGCWPTPTQALGTRPGSSDGSQIDASRDGLDKVPGSSCASSPRPAGHGKRRWVVADPDALPNAGMDYLSEAFMPENDLLPFQDQLFGIGLSRAGTSDITAVTMTSGTSGKLSVWTGTQTVSTSTASIPQLEEFEREVDKLQNQYNEAVAVLLQHWNCSADVVLYLQGVDLQAVDEGGGVVESSDGEDIVPQLPAAIRSVVDARNQVEKYQLQVEECKEQLQGAVMQLEMEERQRQEAVKQVEEKELEHTCAVQQLLQLQQQLEESDEKLVQLAEHLVERDGKLVQLARSVEERDEKLVQLAEHLEERDGELVQLVKNVEERDQKLVQLAEQLGERDEKLLQIANDLELRLKERDTKLAELAQQMETQLQERDLRLAQLAEENQQQHDAAQQQLLEREAQLLQARAKFDELELQLLLHLRGCTPAGELLGSCGPVNLSAQRSRCFVHSSSLLEHHTASHPLQQFAMCSEATFIQHHKLTLAMTRTSSSRPEPHCCPAAAMAALCLSHNVTPASIKSTGTGSLACRCYSSGKSGVRKGSKGRFRFGRRLIFIGMPGAVLVMACMWVAEFWIRHPELIADKRRVLRSKLSWHREK